MKEKIEITPSAIYSLTGMFDQLGFSVCSEKLRQAENIYNSKVERLLCDTYHNKPQSVVALHGMIKDRVAEYESAYKELIVAFDCCYERITIEPPEQKCAGGAG